jgi:hypothetical protein
MTPIIDKSMGVKIGDWPRFNCIERLFAKFSILAKIYSRQANAIVKPTAAIIANLICRLNSDLKERLVLNRRINNK